MNRKAFIEYVERHEPEATIDLDLITCLEMATRSPSSFHLTRNDDSATKLLQCWAEAHKNVIYCCTEHSLPENISMNTLYLLDNLEDKDKNRLTKMIERKTSARCIVIQRISLLTHPQPTATPN